MRTPAPPEQVQARLPSLGAAIARECPDVVFAYLFGSAATGRRRPTSDVDVAIDIDPSADTVTARLDAIRTITRHLGTDAVDVVVLDEAPIALAGRVLLTRQVLVDRDPHRRHRYESRVARLFQDFRIRERRLLDRRAAHGRS